MTLTAGNFYPPTATRVAIRDAIIRELDGRAGAWTASGLTDHISSTHGFISIEVGMELARMVGTLVHVAPNATLWTTTKEEQWKSSQPKPASPPTKPTNGTPGS